MFLSNIFQPPEDGLVYPEHCVVLTTCARQEETNLVMHVFRWEFASGFRVVTIMLKYMLT
jgi:hypothetical protein